MTFRHFRAAWTRLEGTLNETSRKGGCRSVMIATRDGLVIAHRLCHGDEPRPLASVAASVLAEAEAAAFELERGEVREVIIRCAQGEILAQAAGPHALVIALYERERDQTLARYELTSLARDVASVLEEF